MDELRPCPFCGQSPKNYGGDQWYCDNPECPESGVFPADLWNRRAPQPDALVEALQKAERKLSDLLSTTKARGYRGRQISMIVESIMGVVFSVRQGLTAALAAPRPERTYSAAEVRELVEAVIAADDLGKNTEMDFRFAKVFQRAARMAEALRRYGERKDGEAGG